MTTKERKPVRVITTPVYAFNDLDDKAKETARNWFREGQAEHYAWSDEALKSLAALAEHFGGKLTKYSIDFTGAYSPSFATFDMPELEPKEIKRLMSELGSYNKKTLRGLGDCKLTGYCADENAIDGFRIAFKQGERDLETLMQSAFDSWLKDCQSDCEYQNSDEQIDETIRANEYTFTEHGEREG